MFFTSPKVDMSVDTSKTDSIENRHFIRLSENGLMAGQLHLIRK